MGISECLPRVTSKGFECDESHRCDEMPTPGLIVERLTQEIGRNCANEDKAPKFGTLALQRVLIKFVRWAIWKSKMAAIFQHVWILDMVDRSHIESEVKSDSINWKAITYLVGNDTLSFILRCLVPKLKHMKKMTQWTYLAAILNFWSNLLPPPEWPSQI